MTMPWDRDWQDEEPDIDWQYDLWRDQQMALDAETDPDAMLPWLSWHSETPLVDGE